MSYDTDVTNVAIHLTCKTMQRFPIMLDSPIHRFRTSLANLGFIRYLNQLIHVITGFKRDVPCVVRSSVLGPLRYVSAQGCSASWTDWSLWLIHASYLTMHSTSCLILHESKQFGLEFLQIHNNRMRYAVTEFKKNRPNSIFDECK